MKKAKIIFFLFLLSSFFIFLPFKNNVLAQSSYFDVQVGMGEIGMAFGEDSANSEDVRVKVVRIINIVLSILGILVVCLIIFAGFQWMTAAGNEDQVTKAKKTLKNAIIGLVIIFIAWSITSFILTRLAGVSFNNPNYLDPQ